LGPSEPMQHPLSPRPIGPLGHPPTPKGPIVTTPLTRPHRKPKGRTTAMRVVRRVAATTRGAGAPPAAESTPPPRSPHRHHWAPSMPLSLFRFRDVEGGRCQTSNNVKVFSRPPPQSQPWLCGAELSEFAAHRLTGRPQPRFQHSGPPWVDPALRPMGRWFKPADRSTSSEGPAPLTAQGGGRRGARRPILWARWGWVSLTNLPYDSQSRRALDPFPKLYGNQKKPQKQAGGPLASPLPLPLGGGGRFRPTPFWRGSCFDKEPQKEVGGNPDPPSTSPCPRTRPPPPAPTDPTDPTTRHLKPQIPSNPLKSPQIPQICLVGEGL